MPAFLAHCMVIGKVPLEDLAKKAVIRAGNIVLKKDIGSFPFHFRMRGRTTNPWMRLAPSTHSA